MYESPDGEYGRMQPDKSWTGAIKELIDGVINLVYYLTYIFWKVNFCENVQKMGIFEPKCPKKGNLIV